MCLGVVDNCRVDWRVKMDFFFGKGLQFTLAQ